MVLMICRVSIADEAPTKSAHRTPAAAQQLEPAQLKFFEERIRPVLAENCYSCHSTEAKSVKGGLLLDSRDGILTGGDSGPSLIEKNPKDSLLLQAMRHESLEMPPEKKLPDNVLADFESWIQSGAPDPRVGGTVRTKSSIDVEKGREFWSFRPISRPTIPTTGEDWVKNEIDHFVAKAHQNAFSAQTDVTRDKPSPGHSLVAGDANSDALIRRLTFALTGLPPTPEEQSQFAHAIQ